MEQNEVIEMLVKQLRQDHYELSTLSPRLSEVYRKNVDAVRENIKTTLEKAGHKL